jgi:hypothetical protein
VATSGTFQWLPSVDVLLVDAWERCGKAPESLTSTVVESGLRSLQLLLIHWQNLGPRLWTIERVQWTLSAGSASYELPAASMDVLEGGVTILGGDDVMMTPIGRDEYAMIADKATRAQPSQYWVQRGLPLPVVTLYPTPDQDYVVWFNRIRQPQDVSALAQEPEIPVMWAEAVTAELARRLAVKFVPERVPMLQADAERGYAAARAESRERAPLTIKIRRR